MKTGEKTKIVVANFKMNLTAEYELNNWLANFQKVKRKMRPQRTELILCPSVSQLNIFSKKIKTAWIKLGGQDCFWEKKGSFTGAISPVSIKSVGGEYVILGHSERRKYFGETNRLVALKLEVALKAGLKPILCLGESARERSLGVTAKVIEQQLNECLINIGPGKIEKITLCYEPVWAISSNGPKKLPNADEIMEIKLLIKKILTKKFNRSLVERINMLYGGSVDDKNVQMVCLESGMDGVLIGKASLTPYKLLKVVELINQR